METRPENVDAKSLENNGTLVLFEPVEIADVILLTRNLELLCHSQILSLYSGYWKQLFIQAKKHGDVPDMMTLKPKDDIVLQVQKIDLTQLVSESPEQIKMYLEFAYDQSKQVDKHNARDLFQLAQYFMDTALQTRCSSFMAADLDGGSVKGSIEDMTSQMQLLRRTSRAGHLAADSRVRSCSSEGYQQIGLDVNLREL